MVRHIKLASIFFLVVASIVFGMLLAEGLETDVLARLRSLPSATGATPDGHATLGTTALAAGEPALPSFAEVVEQANPSVVFVGVTEVGRRQGRGERMMPFGQPDGPGGPGGDDGEDPFNFFPPRGREDGEDRDFRREGGGSGFIIDKAGWILTNNHVIQGATKVTVKLGDEREFQAEVRGTDPILDVALLKIDAKGDLPVAELGDSESLRAGDWVLAIGNPFVYEHTVTVGVVSHKGRASQNPFSRFIQTDAAINFGNSGGPLLNIRGEVIGINTAISAVGQNIGFAIPINNVKAIMGQLKEKGKVARGFLGVSPQDLDGDLMGAFTGIPVDKGALVVDVEKGSPAAEAGLKVDDVIVKVNDAAVATREDLFHVVGATPPGTKVALSIVREEKKGSGKWIEKTLAATLRERDDAIAGQEPEGEDAPPRQGRPGMKLGLRIEPLTPEARRQLRVPDEVQGVAVAHVFASGPAADAGITIGDVITEVNGSPITTGSELASALESAKEGTVLRLRLFHQGRPRVVAITMRAWEAPE